MAKNSHISSEARAAIAKARNRRKAYAAGGARFGVVKVSRVEPVPAEEIAARAAEIREERLSEPKRPKRSGEDRF